MNQINGSNCICLIKTVFLNNQEDFLKWLIIFNVLFLQKIKCGQFHLRRGAGFIYVFLSHSHRDVVPLRKWWILRYNYVKSKKQRLESIWKGLCSSRWLHQQKRREEISLSNLKPPQVESVGENIQIRVCRRNGESTKSHLSFSSINGGACWIRFCP